MKLFELLSVHKLFISIDFTTSCFQELHIKTVIINACHAMGDAWRLGTFKSNVIADLSYIIPLFIDILIQLLS